MPLSNFLLGKDFPKMEPFVESLQQGIDEELKPLKEEIAQLRTLLGDASAAAAAAAESAAAAAAAAAARGSGSTSGGSNTSPNPTPSVTPNVGGSGQETPEGSPLPTPSITVTPSPSPSSLQYLKDKVIGVSVEPLDAIATIGEITGAGLYSTGDQATLRVASLPTGYTLDGWYTAAGQKVSSAQEYTFTVSTSQEFILKFVQIDTRVNVTIKWNGSLTGASSRNGEYVRRLRIGTNPGNATQVDRDVTFASNTSPGQYPTSISTRVLPGTQVVLNAYGGSNAPVWRLEGSSNNLDRDFDFRPTVPSQDVTYIALFLT